MDQKDEVKSKVDIVELISLYLPLKKTGRNFAGLCPFHSERTPSFMISAERQAFKCFGCGEAGDIFTFLEKIEGWDFREALEELAKRAGVKLRRFEPSGQSRTNDKLIKINKLAAKFYAHLLNIHPVGEVARKYLASRGVKKQLWEKFDLGYAPGSWDKTLTFLTKRGFSTSDIAQAGLIIARLRQGYGGQARQQKGDKPETQYYDRFRNRLMFPLKDGRGTVLGFSARVIDPPSRKAALSAGASKAESEGKVEAKYINSPQTPVFNKGSLLFGLDLARAAIRDKNEAILVEGEFDVMSVHGVGVTNVVASKGTALTEKQVVTLSRICENVALCFDTDLAGDAAQRRGIELLEIAGVGVKVINLGKYKDPDEFCRKDAGGFKGALEQAVNIYDYFIESAASRFDATSADGKKRIGREVLPVLAKISDDLVRAHYIDRLSKVLDIDVSLVAAAVDKKVASVYAFEPQEELASNKRVLGLEEYFLALFLFGEEAEGRTIKFLKPSDFSNNQLANFWKWLRDIIKASGATSFSKILKKLPKNFTKFVNDLYLVNISPAFGERQLWAAEVAKVAVRLKQASLKRQLQQISKSIKIAESKKNTKQVDALTKRFNDLVKQQKEVIL